MRGKSASPRSDSLPRCCRFPPTASPSPDDPEEFQTTSRYALSLADCGPRSIQSPVRATLAQTAFATDLPAVVREAAADRPFERCCFYRCTGPRDVRSAVPTRQTFVGSLRGG